MKRSVTLLLLVFYALLLFARRDPIVMHCGGAIDDRSGNQLFFDMPAAFYDHDEKKKEIIIDGGGAVSYYDVEISSATTGAVEMTTTVSGTYDTFNISSLSAGTHVITIESPSGNTFEGTCFYKS